METPPQPVALEQLLAALSEAQWDRLAQRLSRSRFRRRFRLRGAERSYVQREGLARVAHQAQVFVARRLAPARPSRDGKQTPYRGHPVFVAQHATGTCCRKCLERWHGIAAGKPLTEQEQLYVVAVLARWLAAEMGTQLSSLWQGEQRGLFPPPEGTHKAPLP